MSRASVTTFGRGVSFVASGETGTQANEFEAAIKSVTSSTDVGAVFVYDTRNDSDSGAWRKKCAGLSWFDETLNTATRGGRREFPSVALLVLDKESEEETLTIYDLDDPAMPMWMQFLDAGALKWSTSNARSFNAITALNGRIYVGFQDGLVEFDFANDHTKIGFSGPRYLTSGTAIADRNVTATFATGGDGYTIANIVVNDVAATVLEGAEIGTLGLPIPTVAVATDGGVSVIHPNGDVYDLASTSHSNNDVLKVFFTDDGMVGYNFEASGWVDRAWAVGLRKIPYANANIQAYDSALNLERYMPPVSSATTGLTTNTDEYSQTDAQVNAVTPTSKNGLAIGYGDRLSIVKRNPANMEEGAVAYVTSGYNSGYLLGDIRGAFLANTKGGDKSVKGNTLAENGSIDAEKVDGASGTADLYAYKSFSSTKFLSKDLSSNTDFDFGTGDFSISLWAKNTNWTGDQRFLGRSQSASARRLSLYASTVVTGSPPNEVTTTSLVFYLADGGATHVTVANVLKTNTWQHIFACRKSSKLYLYVDGRLVGTPVDSTTNITPTTASALVIGAETFNNLTSISNPFTNGSLSLVRISATAPTPQQVKDIYEAEKPLFRAGAKCLIKGDSGVNTVKALSFDKTTNLLSVGVIASAGVSGANMFRGLERVETFTGDDIVGEYDDPTNLTGWNGNTIAKLSTAGGVSAYSRITGNGGLIVDLPPFDVRGDTNIADTKLPDDGKLHFTGVTTDATPTVIGNIPIAENERYTVRAKVVGQVYNDNDNSYIDVVDEKIFYREAGSDIGFRTSSYKMTDANHDSFDVEIVKTTGGSDSPQNITSASNLIMIKVTGKSASPSRIVWNATVEVQRISEKEYER